MNNAMIIVNQLKAMEIPQDSARMLRAMFVAQAYAYLVPINMDSTTEHVMEQHGKDFVNTLSDINERILVDTKLARNLFERMVATRLMLLKGVTSTGVLVSVLQSDEQLSRLNDEETNAVKMLLSLPTFKSAQASIRDSLFIEEKDNEGSI